jgi:hypothetical protein
MDNLVSLEGTGQGNVDCKMNGKGESKPPVAVETKKEKQKQRGIGIPTSDLVVGFVVDSLG